MKRRTWLLGSLVALGALLATAGNIVGNLVADEFPSEWKPVAPFAFAGVTIAAFAGTLTLGTLQGAGVTATRSRARRLATIALIVLTESLAAAGGVLSNVASSSLPDVLRPYAPWVFLGLTPLVLGLAVLLYLLQSTPRVDVMTRQALLKKLRDRFSRLQSDALRGAPLIALGLQAQPGAEAPSLLSSSRATSRQTSQVTNSLFPIGATISQVYDAADGNLLVLGEPGAGKTTLLVELALDLLRRARDDQRQPLPIILNLSTWAINRGALPDWIVEDLENTYRVSRKVARSWVNTGAVLPLLDGLDEVDGEQRPGCVKAINDFLALHPALPLVACSRAAEYHALRAKLALQTAVVVQPLTDEQISAYLANGGDKLAPLRDAVEADAQLHEVLRIPLMLNLVTLTYGDLPRESIPPVDDHEAWRRQIFQDYVAKMLERDRGLEPAESYTPEETAHLLTALARQMKGRQWIQISPRPLWPDRQLDSRLYLRFRLMYGLAVGPVFALIFGFAVGPVFAFLFGPVVGLISIGLAACLGGGLAGLWPDDAGEEGEGLRAASLLVGFSILMLAWGYFWGPDWWVLGGVLGVMVGLGILVPVSIGDLDALEGFWMTLVAMALMGLMLGLGAGLLFGTATGVIIGVSYALIVGLLLVLTLLLTNPWIRALIIGTLVWFVFGPVVALDGVFATRLRAGAIAGAVASLAVGILYCIAFAADVRVPVSAAIASRFFRRMLGLPKHPARFLDYAAEHFLLRKEGGSYRFVHILLRDYFADLYIEQQEKRL